MTKSPLPRHRYTTTDLRVPRNHSDRSSKRHPTLDLAQIPTRPNCICHKHAEYTIYPKGNHMLYVAPMQVRTMLLESHSILPHNLSAYNPKMSNNRHHLHISHQCQHFFSLLCIWGVGIITHACNLPVGSKHDLHHRKLLLRKVPPVEICFPLFREYSQPSMLL